jgi:hypothetical protein
MIEPMPVQLAPAGNLGATHLARQSKITRNSERAGTVSAPADFTVRLRQSDTGDLMQIKAGKSLNR